jgi:monovalent cation:H+ antiporter-2, CPA2 family
VGSVDGELQGHTIVAGYGCSGRAAARVLQKAGIPVTVVEFNHAVFNDVAVDGLNGIWGDVTAGEILQVAQIETARLLLLTVPDPGTVHLTVQRARQLNPSIAIIARVSGPDNTTRLREAGVDALIQPEFEGGVEMVRQALVRYSCGGEAASRLVSEARDELYGGTI